MKAIKPVPFRHKPQGMSILYEDQDIIVIDKSSGLLTVKANYEKQITAHQILTEYIRRGSSRSTRQLFVVHRLDRETSGVLVFAKTFQAMENLKQQWGSVTKKYIAVVHGILAEKRGTITSYLAENDEYEVYSVKDPEEGKLAVTRFKVIKESNRFSLLEIELLTGKKNQIRVHFFEVGHPIVNDNKYGNKIKIGGRLALHSHYLTFKHPHNGKELTFEAKVPEFFYKIFDETQGLSITPVCNTR
jgi:tRNA pseudouridine32 synthase/23S rRNA pseudouridine746 synthase/23S rRNA pseudouridine1911/1915/1917 synthase